jgi:hypothetical protein
MNRLASAQVTSRRCVFFFSPRKRTLAKPNTRLMIPIACSTRARTLDLVRFFLRSTLIHDAAVAVAAMGEIAGLVGIFGRRRRIDDCRIDDRARGHFQSLRRQMPLHFVEQLLAQIVRLEQMTEAAHRRLVGHRLATESLPSRRRGLMSTKRRIADES